MSYPVRMEGLVQMDRSHERKIFTLKLAKSKQYATQTITNALYADDTALLVNKPTQDESQLHSCKWLVALASV